MTCSRPCSPRPAGHLRCASSAPPGASVGMAQDWKAPLPCRFSPITPRAAISSTCSRRFGLVVIEAENGRLFSLPKLGPGARGDPFVGDDLHGQFTILRHERHGFFRPPLPASRRAAGPQSVRFFSGPTRLVTARLAKQDADAGTDAAFFLPFVAKAYGPRLLPVDFQPQLPFDLLVQEPLQARQSAVSHYEKVACIAHQKGFDQLGRAVLGMKYMGKPLPPDIHQKRIPSKRRDALFNSGPLRYWYVTRKGRVVLLRRF